MEKINVAELLKDCPKGMELDCTMFEGVYFDHVDESRLNRIKCYVNNGDEHFEIEFEEYGQYISNDSAKCVIFPKGKTTWEGFVPPCKFKDGDILYCNANDDGEDKDMFKYIFIFDKIIDVDGTQFYYSHCHLFGNEFYDTKTNLVNDYSVRFATEEEKEKLFQAIKDNGYKWNAETKTLEKLAEPQFKVGDRIWLKENHNYIYPITGIKEKENKYECGVTFVLRFSEQDNWELVPNKFDITTLKPFESKVLVWEDQCKKWIPAFWGSKCDSGGYITTYGWCKYCIPLDGNEHLTGTSKDCDKFYKTWRD